MKPILSIQYLRGLAILLVVATHNTAALHTYAPDIAVFHGGAFGADLFFVISGFIIWTISNVRPAGPGKFIKKRLLRIVPLYWAMTLATLFAAGWLMTDTNADTAQIFRSFLFIPEWRGDYALPAPVLFVGWTLNLQMLFYVIFACVLFLTPAKRLPVMLAILFTLASVRLSAGEPAHPALHLYTYSVIAEFGLGVLLGWAYLKGLFKLGAERGAWMNGLTLIFTAVTLLFLRDRLPDVRALYYGAPALLIVAGALFCEGAIRKYPSALVKFLGDASYSIYLSHIIAVAISLKLMGAPFGSDYPMVILTAQIAFAAAFGGAVYLLVEKPLTNAARWAAQPGKKPLRFVFPATLRQTGAVSPEKP